MQAHFSQCIFLHTPSHTGGKRFFLNPLPPPCYSICLSDFSRMTSEKYHSAVWEMENILQYSISPHIRKVAGSLDRRNPVLPGYFCHADPFSSVFRKPDPPAPSFDNAIFSSSLSDMIHLVLVQEGVQDISVNSDHSI